MINKLRKKIFWIIQLSLTIIILGIIIIFAGFSYKNTITSSTMFIDRINGRVDERPNETRENTDPFSVNVEGVYKIEFNNSGIIREFTGVTEETRNYALKISKKTSREGYIGDYIYRIRKIGNNGKEITLIENADAIKRLKLTILIAITLGLVGIAIVYIIAKKISKTIVEPVEESFEKQKQFISDASHELKTPLAVIEANADVLQEKTGDNKWLTYIQNEVQSMNKLVNDLLTLSRMEKNADVHNQKFDLSKEVQMSVAVFESMIYEKGIRLKTNIDEGISFNGEKEDIKHIISILLDNAIKHTKEKGKIIVNTKKENNNVIIEIKNQGEPIPEEEREKIFERFYRIDKARNRNEKRYGLGLSIAKGIVEKYKGSIKASSKDGFTSFLVKI